ncbi:MAG: phosphoserine aminotransferase, partial [Myxococcota bacterium]
NYQILFLQGGASTQFAMVPLNLMGKNGTADYLVTGAWGKKAAVEAGRVGTAHVAWSGSDEGFVRVPDRSEYELNPDAAYVHMTSNETVHGVQWQEFPESVAPIVCDVSSDFLSRPKNVGHFGMLYAGAQKNVGPAGVTIVIMSDELIERTPTDQFSMLSYRVHAAKQSMFNTPPCFGIYVVELVTRWLLETIGGLDAMAALNAEKAARLYRCIDQSGGFYAGRAATESRSSMNVTLGISDPSLEPIFVSEADQAGLIGLKGHRMLGGLRASIYNAMTLEGIDALTDFMTEFKRTRG